MDQLLDPNPWLLTGNTDTVYCSLMLGGRGLGTGLCAQDERAGPRAAGIRRPPGRRSRDVDPRPREDAGGQERTPAGGVQVQLHDMARAVLPLQGHGVVVHDV
jgi:CubicO group peptidase (beta-lactamase class C family)